MMNYIILDMEWNQPWPGSPSSKKVLPVQIRGEIIQIGAVRVTEDQQVTDEFQVMVKPNITEDSTAGSASSPASRRPNCGKKESLSPKPWSSFAPGAERISFS